MRYAIQVAYDGLRYHGFVRQPGLPTVEGELLRAFQGCGLFERPSEARYRVASRTDRWVSALGQVVAFDSVKFPELEEVNSWLPEDITCLAVQEVDPRFNPRRRATRKHYRYFWVARESLDLGKIKRAAELLVGVHDFSNFCKRERGRSTVVELERAKVKGKRTLVFDFIGKAFLWQQVRRMVNALVQVGGGKLELDEFKKLISREVERPVPPAPAHGLILVEIEFKGLRLEPDPGALKRFSKYLQGELVSQMQRLTALKHLIRLMGANVAYATLGL